MSSSRTAPSSFFARSVLEVAPDLIGMYLVRKRGNQIFKARITEVEAYDGPHDKASHGRFGNTPRTKIMFGPPGYFYVYLIYGMYWMLNMVADREGYPAAVLIRGVETVAGPGRLTREWGIDSSFNGKAIACDTGLWVEFGDPVKSDTIIQTSRIGVAYAGQWADKPYRFVLNQ